MSASPTVAFLFRHPAHFLALGLGAGLSRVAPGTFGTLVAIPLAFLLHAFASDWEFVVVVVVLFVIGAWAAQVTGRNLGVPDHGAIVVDEIAAFLLVLHFVGLDWVRVAGAFVIFRLFDIVKPPPIRWIDEKVPGGAGVVLDDVAAGALGCAVMVGLARLGWW